VKNKTILVVDNEEAIRETLLKILKREGYDVLTAADGQEALEIIRAHEVHLILSDICMPRIDGHKLLKQVKAILPGVEIVLMTGQSKWETGLEALKEGAFAFIPKPFNKLALNKTVRKALEKQATAASSLP
jgi:DNA-binding NtrC family response regulator